MVEVHAMIPEDIYEWLRRRAYEEHRSMGAVVREILAAAKAEAERKAGDAPVRA